MNPPLDRRRLLLASALAAAVPGAADAEFTETAGQDVELWPGGAPGRDHVTVREEIIEASPGSSPRDRAVQHVTRPLLTWFAPRGTPTGITFLVIPGGSYRRVVIDREGFDTAAWLTGRGFGTAVLRYRLPGDGCLVHAADDKRAARVRIRRAWLRPARHRRQKRGRLADAGPELGTRECGILSRSTRAGGAC